LQLNCDQQFHSLGVARNASQAPRACPQSSYDAENPGQVSNYKKLKCWAHSTGEVYHYHHIHGDRKEVQMFLGKLLVVSIKIKP
jgi:uncharacterized protein YjlB